MIASEEKRTALKRVERGDKGCGLISIGFQYIFVSHLIIAM